jgi:hypothetical protein
MTEGQHIRVALSRRLNAWSLRAACALVALAELSCSNPVPDLRPPPFGPDVQHPLRAQLFFPTGMAVAPSGHLLVVNGNFDHAFDGGTLVAFDPRDFKDAQGRSLLSFYASDGAVPATVDVPVIPQAWFRGVAMIGNYGGPLAVYADQGGARVRAFTGARDANRLDQVQLDPATGALSCDGTPGNVDCRAGAFDTFNAVCPPNGCPASTDPTLDLEGPYGVAIGTAQLPGQTTPPRDVLFVSALVPHIDSIINNQLFTRSQFAALTLDGATPALFYGANASSETAGNGIGAGPMVFDAKRRRLVLAGCYTRFASTNGANPSSGKCGSTSANLIRFVSVDEGPDANVQIFDVAATVRASETTGLALGAFDANGVAQRLYATVRNPDLFVEMELPPDPGTLARVVRATPLPIAPAGLTVLPRPAGIPGGDLIAIAGEGSGTVSVYDTASGQVVANLQNLGSLPYTLVQLQAQADDQSAAAQADPRAHLAAAAFDNCRVALVDVPYLRPWKSALRATVGSCP